MKAIILYHRCSADEMRVSEIPIPEVKLGWVLVKIHAAGLNHSEALLRMFEIENDYIQKPIVPGIECVGEIADPSDSHFSKGDKVIALMGGMGRSFNGSYAEYALLPAANVFKVETDLDWISLAAVPETYFTAYGSLTECLLLKEGDTLLVRGATSTVGQAAVQLGKAIGARVIAACRKEKDFDRLKAIGAGFCCIDDGNLAESLPTEMRPNKVLELVGPATLQDSLCCVTRPGYVCNTGILGNVFTVEHFDPIKYIPNGVFLSGFFSNFPTKTTIDAMFDLINKTHIKPLYAKVFGLDEIAQAHALLEKGGAGGKIILKING
ncbi:MAG: zinc-binding dehydrogenase [Bacteroidales bacterium]|nr:zinc-binding dehydrogenase [Bacteroidales bacterium]